MPAKLDRCVEHLKEKGYSEEEAWAICRKKLKYDLQLAYEKAKRIFTGQFINDNYIKAKEKELKNQKE
jgi:hypothetical protein